MSYLSPTTYSTSQASSSTTTRTTPTTRSSSIPTWQSTIESRLIARTAREGSQSEIIGQYERLVNTLGVWKERNRVLVQGSVTSGGGSSTAGTNSGEKGGNDSVRIAMIDSLERELSTLRNDLSEQYKLQSLNAQRLLSLTDQLREAEERGREEREELRSLRHEVEGLRDKQRGFREIVQDKEKQIVILQDDHTSLSLELSQQDLLISRLREDNKNLLDRWLEAKRAEAESINEANEWVSQARKLKIAEAGEAGGGGGGKEKKDEEEEVVVEI